MSKVKCFIIYALAILIAYIVVFFAVRHAINNTIRLALEDFFDNRELQFINTINEI